MPTEMFVCSKCNTRLLQSEILIHAEFCFGNDIARGPIQCPKCQELMFPEAWTDHWKNRHYMIGGPTMYFCQVCNAGFPSYSEEKSHSCGEIRRRNQGGLMYPCGMCQSSFRTKGDLEAHIVREHDRSLFNLPSTTTKGSNGGGKRGRRRRHEEDSNWYCFGCQRTFQNGWEHEQHVCPGEERAKVAFADIANKISAIGRPDTKKEEDTTMLISCGKCGNRFPGMETFQRHACQAKQNGLTRVALFVSPDRKDKASMRVAAVDLGAKNIYYVRGIPAEEEFIKIAKEMKAEVVQSGSAEPDLRDKIMIERADLILMFPNIEKSPGMGIVKKKLKVGGRDTREVPCIIYPDHEVPKDTAPAPTLDTIV